MALILERVKLNLLTIVTSKYCLLIGLFASHFWTKIVCVCVCVCVCARAARRGAHFILSLITFPSLFP